ncbi:alpha/beta fold hydrolase [Paenibacillus sp. 2TAB19]|uniref:alpha/beta fold hydrolase n=1 Tax=Paenibacillus sp. 2TAB19 TaxID=3233003 RepID=UPI003F984409
MDKTVKKKKWTKIAVIGCIVAAILAVSLFFYIQSITYTPSDRAQSAVKSDSQVKVTVIKEGYKFEPTGGNVIQPNIIFYPGGLVEPKSYSPLARELAELGHRVYIADMPLNLAIFGQNKADSFLNEHPDESFIIGGHSLGGSFAARYASQHSNALKGVFFLASYADEKGAIKDTELSVLQITGTDDGVMNEEDWENSKTNLPDDTIYVGIEGGNHGQFGSYGKQKGDNDAAIEEEKQLEIVVNSLQDWFAEMNLTP